MFATVAIHAARNSLLIAGRLTVIFFSESETGGFGLVAIGLVGPVLVLGTDFAGCCVEQELMKIADAISNGYFIFQMLMRQK